MHLDHFPIPILDTSTLQLLQPLLILDYLLAQNLLGKSTYGKT